MARPKSDSDKSSSTLPVLGPEKGIELLLRQVERGKALLTSSSLSESDFNSWSTVSERCIVRIFGDESDRHYSFLTSGAVSTFSASSPFDRDGSRSEANELRRQLKDRISNLESSIEALKLDVEIAAALTPATTGVKPPLTGADSSIFLVHGHDHAALQGVARFIEHLGLAPIILHEQPNRGRTVFEKFIDHSHVGFAIVLLTPDDIGRSIKETPEEERLRARQNVILELGYFLGKIGRERVCPLYVPEVEIPSDYLGVAYTSLDGTGEWKFTLARELKAAGFAIDLNKAM
jgi:predicted nucleotide-binding protein